MQEDCQDLCAKVPAFADQHATLKTPRSNRWKTKLERALDLATMAPPISSLATLRLIHWRRAVAGLNLHDSGRYLVVTNNRIWKIDSNRDIIVRRQQLTNWIAVVISGAALVLDLGTKAWVRASLPSPDGLDVASFLALRPRYNEGTTFGLLSGSTALGLLVLVAVNALAVFALWWWAAHTRERWVALGAALMAAGALGNLIDRLLVGMVTDFIGLHLGAWYSPIFNLADLWVIVGLLLALYGPRKPTRHGGNEAAS